METFDEGAYIEVDPAMGDEWNDLRNEEVGVSPPARKPKRAKSKKKTAAMTLVPTAAYGPSDDDNDRKAAFERAAAGVAAASVMTSAFSAKPTPMKWKPLVLTCAAVGLGALYIGVLFYLYRKMATLDASVKDAMDEVRKLAALIEADQGITDEPLPRSAPPRMDEDSVDELSSTLASLRIAVTGRRQDDAEEEDPREEEEDEEEEEEVPRVQELPTPARVSVPQKKRPRKASSAAAKPVVLDLDSAAAPSATPSS